MSCFHKNKTKKDGYANPCKHCTKQYNRMWRERNKENNKSKSSALVTKKVCLICKIDKSIDNFSIDRSFPTGVESRCKSCRNTRHAKYYSSYYPKYSDALRKETFRTYGNTECAVCNISDIGVLTLDHINNDGPALVRIGQPRGGLSLFQYLRYRSYPTGFQLLCHNCNWRKYLKTITPSKNRTAINSRRRRQRLKHQAIKAYGNKCEWCKEPDIEVLTIDHINSNGSTHRKQLGLRCGENTYRYLKTNNYPKGFQVLCRNCNSGSKYRSVDLKKAALQ